ncbi:Serine/threonine kinase [Acanthamoeba castellanii str. Neff]|uniref:Serine/threonine kinase n=1 Tax=Acanthamoeba castellanii (strain ATCC 30010 / Neff) TaxID=1257118 RepID=L8HH12_ACACF|nr:Serine/threonine kinase [Acanthamoeba castellanii str. Neff]ELR23721.1 Serine/threonine kinase [Acanthamoeba castellanii str. Neff]
MKGRGHFVPFKERGRAHGHEETHRLNKTLLDFGIDRRKQCPVNALLTDTLILANTGKKPLRVRLYYPYRSHKFSLLFNKKEKAIVVEMVVKLTTVIDQPVYIEVEDIGHTLLNIKLESELSTLFDYEEIAVQGPAIGIGGFGRVFKGTWRGGEVAVKVLKDQNPSEPQEPQR